MAVSRRYLDPVTGIRHSTEADKSRAIRARETEQAADAHRRRVLDSNLADLGRQALAADLREVSRVRQVNEADHLSPSEAARALSQIGTPIAATAPRSEPRSLASATPPVREPILLSGEPRNATGQQSAFARKVDEYRRLTGTDTVAAIAFCQSMYPELADQHREDVNSTAGRPPRWTDADERQLEGLVRARQARTGETYGDALAELSREQRDLFDQRTRALSLPIESASAGGASGAAAVTMFENMVADLRRKDSRLTAEAAIRQVAAAHPDLADAQRRALSVPIGPGGVVMTER